MIKSHEFWLGSPKVCVARANFCMWYLVVCLLKGEKECDVKVGFTALRAQFDWWIINQINSFSEEKGGKGGFLVGEDARRLEMFDKN